MGKQSNWTEVESYVDTFKNRPNNRLLGQVEHVINKQYETNQGKRDTAHLHPSSLSKNDWCPRSNYYDLTDEHESNPRKNQLRTLNIFAEGNAIHSKWQEWMWKTGCLVGNWRCNRCGHGWMAKSPLVCPECSHVDIEYREVPIYNEEHHIIGHSDGEWEDHEGRALVEIKSVGLGTIRWDAPALYAGYENGELSLDDLWKKIKRPLLPHRRQINLYMYCRKIDNAIVIYEWKPTQEVKEFHLTLDMSIVQPMLDGAKQVIAAIDAGVAPDRPDGFMRSKQCKFCSFKDKCWTKEEP